MKNKRIFGFTLLVLFVFFGCTLGTEIKQDEQSYQLELPDFSGFSQSELEVQELDLMSQFDSKSLSCPPLTIKTETSFKEGHILSDFLLKFKEIVEKISFNKVKVEVVSGINTEEEVNFMCSDGRIDIQSTGGFPLQEFAPEYFFFNAPYVIKDYDHFKRVWDSDIGEAAKNLILNDGNMISLNTVYRGNRQMTSNKAISGPDDIIDLKLRLPGVPDWITVWEELEANVVAVPLTGLYDALATGLAEASEGDLTQIYSFNLYEVQSHLSMTNHLVGIGWVTVNEDFFNDLPFLYKLLVVFSSHCASEWASDKIISGETDLLAALEAEGMTISNPDANAIRIKATPAVENLFATKWPVTTWDEVLSK